MEASPEDKNEKGETLAADVANEQEKNEEKSNEFIVLIWVIASLFFLVVLVLMTLIYSLHRNDNTIKLDVMVLPGDKNENGTRIMNPDYFNETLKKEIVSGISINSEIMKTLDHSYKLDNGIQKVEINFKLLKPLENLSYMFESSPGIIMVDFSNFKISDITYMSHTFSGCERLSYVNLNRVSKEEEGKLNEKIKDLSYLFSGCTALSTVIFEQFKTYQVTDMSSMFENCKILSSLDLSNVSNEHCKSHKNMFSGCSNLKYIDLRNFTGSKNQEEFDNSWTGAFDGLPEEGVKIILNKTKWNDIWDYLDEMFSAKNWTLIDISNENSE